MKVTLEIDEARLTEIITDYVDSLNYLGTPEIIFKVAKDEYGDYKVCAKIMGLEF